MAADNSLTRGQRLGGVSTGGIDPATAASIKRMSSAARKWADNELRRVMTKASRDAAAAIVPHVQRHVPVRRGVLRANIKAKGTRTIPKIQAGTKAKGGPYAWFVHRGHRGYPGVPYMKLGISEGFSAAMKVYIKGQREAAKVFNAATKRNTGKYQREKF